MPRKNELGLALNPQHCDFASNLPVVVDSVHWIVSYRLRCRQEDGTYQLKEIGDQLLFLFDCLSQLLLMTRRQDSAPGDPFY